MDLFSHAMQDRMKTEAPLAARMRPRTLDEFVGQEEIVGEGRLLRRAIEADGDRQDHPGDGHRQPDQEPF
jgi:putative ATPase